MEFEDLIKKRASIRRYAAKIPPMEAVIAAIEAAHLAPSPGNLDILRYLVIENKETIKEIADACQQPFIEEAPILVVICSDPRQVLKMYDKRAEKYIRQHAGAAIENFLLTVTDMEMASCWIGAFSDPMIHNILKIPDNITVEAILPVGYEHKTSHTTQRKKFSLDRKIHYHKYGNIFRIKIPQVRRTDI
jgi:nitroreductase